MFSGSLKKIEKFKNSNTIDIEVPIRVFIAGAKFRSKKPTDETTKDNDPIINI